jgi:hypothetical protein
VAGRLLRGGLKLGVIAAAIGALVIVGKRLMGGLGPEPGSELAPKEWPSLVPEPVTPEASDTASDNGSTPGGTTAEQPPVSAD